MQKPGQQVVWISHRGYHKDWMENTKKAFDAALGCGFHHLETDLRSTADGHIVLHHDPTLEKSCGRSLSIERSRLSEIRQLRTLDDQPLMILEEFLQNYAGCNWTLDIKPETGTKTLHLLKNWAERKKAESWLNAQARFLLWNRESQVLARQIFPAMNCLAPERACYRAGLAVLLKLGGFSGIQGGTTYTLPRFFMGRDLFTSQIVKAYHKRGARILAYLPERDEDAIAAVEAGFDEILTNGSPLL